MSGTQKRVRRREDERRGHGARESRDAGAPRLALLIMDEDMARRADLCALLLEQEDLVRSVRTAGTDPSEWYAAAPDVVFMALDGPAGASGARPAHGPVGGPLLVGISSDKDDAYRAFELGAASFILHPPTPARLRHVLEMARTRQALDALLRSGEDEGEEHVEEPEEGGARLIRVKVGRRYRYIPTHQIVWVEAEGNYVRIHLEDESHLLRVSLSGLLDQLDGGRFRQVHRSSVVNVEWLRELEPWGNGDYVALLANGAKVRVSRGFADAVFRPVL